ncbi:MAG TPA: nuclear transport factor 2 family protein [Vicinamibacteria bacterium]|nr:nuclear transport factor 2 family protein [Vicinamibacteria bacterium]
MSQPAWLAPLFQAIDAKDADKFASFLTDDAVFRFGNAAPARGKAGVQQAVAGFFTSIAALRHTLGDAWAHPDAVVLHGEVTYTRHDGSQLTVPFANVFKMRGSLIREYLVFADVSALWTAQS